MGKTISCSAGAVATKHDRRDYDKENLPQNINGDMMMYNTYIRTCRTEREAFNEFFRESLEQYNAKQSRADRKKTDYYGEIQKSKNGETPIYEYVFQIGNKEDTPCQSEDGIACKRILFEYAMQFSKDNPNFHVISSCIHMDEETPHLHVAFIPWANGYKKGLETRCSTSKALESMGYVGENRNMKSWKRAQEDKIEQMMNERGMDRERKGITRGHLSVPLYKETMDRARADAEIEKEQILASAKEELNEVQTNLNYAMNDYEAVKVEYEDYLEERESLIGEINALKEEKYTLQTEISHLKGIVAHFKAEFEKMNRRIEEITHSFKEIGGSLVERMEKYMRSLTFSDGRTVYDGFCETQRSLQERIAEARRESAEMKKTLKEYEKLIGRSSSTSVGGGRTKSFQNSNENENENDNFGR